MTGDGPRPDDGTTTAARDAAARADAVGGEPAARADAVGREPAAGADALARATRALQGEPEPGWPDLADRVTRRLRTVSRPGRPLTMATSDAGTLRVDQRVVVDLVRRAVTAVPACRPLDVAVAVEDQAVSSLRVQVAARYGAPVPAVAAAAREATAASLVELLGRRCPVDVDVVDVDLDLDLEA
ncbi:hypothetical protein [Jannaschia sp. R86511]|uniref:hypothetical protein n=1 Tax=Jannaschia sp. R86511 TaxID=3093853 RepID=UPI0036D34D81